MSDDSLREVHTICGLCPQGCWVKAHVSKGELVAVSADSHPLYGSICPKGRLAPRVVYSDDRIKNPLIRSGPKGTAEFRQATWDEALDRIAGKFLKIRENYGARALASYMGAGTLEDGLTDCFEKVLGAFGSPNDMSCGSVCYVSSRILAPVTTLGIHGDSITTDFENAKLIILWGANPFKEGLPNKVRQIQTARTRGAKLLVIDPRRHRLTRDADHWIPIVPGTDGALIHALINIIIKRGWYDLDFVREWTFGFEELAGYASLFAPEVAAKICNIDVGTIEWLAENIAKTPGVAADFYSGLEYAPSGVQNTRALYSLLALTGNLDVEGGLYVHAYPHDQYAEHKLDVHDPPLGSREHPVFYALTGSAHVSGLAAAVLHDDPYPVRGLLVTGGSPSRSYPDPDTWRRVYQSLDFMAVVDRFMTEETLWADVVLPATTYYEIDSYHLYRDHLRLRRRVIDPVGQAMNDSLIMAAIAQRIGVGDCFPGTENEIIRRAFEACSRSVADIDNDRDFVGLPIPERRLRKYKSGDLRSDGSPGFPTPTGKFEFVSSILKRYGYDPLPVYSDPRQGGVDAAFPLMLTTGARSRARFNSQYLDRPELAARNVAAVEINPADAEARGIKSGDIVIIRTETGEMSLEARVTPDMGLGSVHMPYGGGGSRQIGSWKDAHVNTIIPHNMKDPISGYPVLKAVKCEIVRVEMMNSDAEETALEESCLKWA